jgi:membrane protein YdbS with pleckstrin-like domain
MNSLKLMDEKSHPVTLRWILKDVLIWSPILFVVTLPEVPEKDLYLYFFIASWGIPLIIFLFLVYMITSYRYEINEKGIFLKYGRIFKAEKTITYNEIKDIYISRGVFGRLLNVASIVIRPIKYKVDLSYPTSFGYDLFGFWGTWSDPVLRIQGVSYKDALEIEDIIKQKIINKPQEDAPIGFFTRIKTALGREIKKLGYAKHGFCPECHAYEFYTRKTVKWCNSCGYYKNVQ